MLNDQALQYTDDEDDKLDSVPTIPATAGDPSFVGPMQPQGMDSLSSAQAAPQAAPKPASIPMVTAEDLQQAQDTKRQMAGMAGVGQALANQQSFGNYFLGRMNPHQDVMGPAQAQMGIVDQGIKNKELLQKQSLMAPELQYMQQAIDPNSDVSKTAIQLHQALLKKYATGLGSKNPEMAQIFANAADSLNGKSAYQAGQIMDGPLGKIMSQEDIANTKNQIMAALAGARLDIARHNSNRADDTQAAGAGGKIDSNPLIQSSQRQLNQIQIDKHTLQSANVITPQMVHEIGAGIAAALNQGKSVGLGQMEMQDMATSQTKLAQLEQTLLNRPENGASPEIKQQMLDTLDRLGESYAKVQGATAKKLAIGRNYAHNPAAQQALSDKVQSYQPTGAPNPAPTGPKPGDIEDGHRFKGGDPSKQENWEAI